MIILILAICGLMFAIKNTDGPWNIVGRWRNLMMRIPVIGVQFYNLISCSFCVGCWSGLFIYLLFNQDYHLNDAICWFLAGGAMSLLFDAILSRLHAN